MKYYNLIYLILFRLFISFIEKNIYTLRYMSICFMYLFILSPQPQPHPPDSFAWPVAINSAGLKSHPSDISTNRKQIQIWSWMGFE